MYVDAIAPVGHKRFQKRNKYGKNGGKLGIIKEHPSTLEARGKSSGHSSPPLLSEIRPPFYFRPSNLKN
jgi:hypothetical protein